MRMRSYLGFKIPPLFSKNAHFLHISAIFLIFMLPQLLTIQHSVNRNTLLITESFKKVPAAGPSFHRSCTVLKEKKKERKRKKERKEGRKEKK